MSKLKIIGVVITAVVMVMGARVVSANHPCGGTCDEFTAENVCTHGCWAGGDPNPDFRGCKPPYNCFESVPAEDTTDGGDYSTAAETRRRYKNNTEDDYKIDPSWHNNKKTAKDVKQSGEWRGVATPSNNDPSLNDKSYEYITFTCDRCGQDRRCQTEIGTNPQFSFGAKTGACNQVDRRKPGDKDWQVVSLCDPACSGGGAITTTEENGGETGEDKDKKKQSSMACKSLSKDVATPELNQKVKFTCQANFSAVKPAYEFRHRVGSGDYTVVSGKASDQKKKATAEVTVNQAGTWEVQCRVCTDDKKKMCTSWGQAQ